MNFRRSLATACLMTAAVVDPPTFAQTTTISETDFLNFLDFRQVNSFAAASTYLSVGVYAVPSGTSAAPSPDGTSVVASQVSSTCSEPALAVPYNNEPSQPSLFFTSLAYNPSTQTPGCTGPWTLTITNATATNSPFVVNTGPIAGVVPLNAQVVPFVTNAATSDLSTTPTISWTVPSGWTVPAGTTVHGVVNIYPVNAAGTGTEPGVVHINTPAAPGEAVSIPIVPGGNNQALAVGTSYLVSVQTNLWLTAYNNSTVEVTRSYFNFAPQASPPSFSGTINLPASDVAGTYTFAISDIVAGVPVLIDPAIAVGYEYAVGAGNPCFQSVEFPRLSSTQGNYELDVWNGHEYTFYAHVAPMTTFRFEHGGVERFRVRGIPTSALLNPLNTTAFVTQVTFTKNGQFTGTMTPLTVDTPS